MSGALQRPAQLVKHRIYFFLLGLVWESALAATLLTLAGLLRLESSCDAFEATAGLVCLLFRFAILSPLSSCSWCVQPLQPMVVLRAPNESVMVPPLAGGQQQLTMDELRNVVIGIETSGMELDIERIADWVIANRTQVAGGNGNHVQHFVTPSLLVSVDLFVGIV